jgi:O-antigen ligase/tetratricopeptide (TPR) repeat protein
VQKKQLDLLRKTLNVFFRMNLSMTKSIFAIFIFVLLFSPLAFGAVEQWSLTVMETLCIGALFLLTLRNVKYKRVYYQVPGLFFLLALLTYQIFQMIPLPSQLIQIVSPETYNIVKHSVLVNSPAAWVSLSVNKKATLLETFRFVSYIALYILTVQLLSDRERLKKTVFIIVIFASLISLFGIIQHLLWSGKIYWFRETAVRSIPFGPYVNRNHYAGFMEMILPIVIGLFLFYKPRVSYRSFREKMAEIFNLEGTNVYMLLGFAAVLIGTSIFLSLSRSGIVSLCLSMIVFGFLVITKGHNRKRGILVIIVCILIGLAVGWFGWGPIIERFQEIGLLKDDFPDYRPIIWKDSREILRDFLLTGTGFGSYIYVYPLYRSLPIVYGILDHAHNDYIEILAEGGLISFFIIAAFLLVFFYKSFKAFIRRYELFSIYLFIGCISGIVSMLIHSFTDFNLHIGANGLFFFFLMGLAVAASHTRFREGLGETYLRRRKITSKLPVFLTGLVFFSCLIFNTGVIGGKIFFRSAQEINTAEKLAVEDLSLIQKKIQHAAILDPLEASYQYVLANIERQFANYERSLTHYQRAVALNYVNGEYLQKFGLLLAMMKKYEHADTLLRAGITYSNDNHQSYKRYIVWLLSMNKKHDAADFIRKAIAEKPRATGEYLKIMEFYNFSHEDIFGALPDRFEPHILYAEYLAAKGNDALAYNTYMDSLKYLKGTKKVESSYFSSAYNYYMKKGLYDEALAVMRKAIEILPQDTSLRMQTALVYEKLNITYRAAEEYRQVLALDPQSQEARRRLDAILSKK